MIFIRSGIHMVAFKDGSVINIQSNPKFVCEVKQRQALIHFSACFLEKLFTYTTKYVIIK